jgi:hypothetical protein
MIWDTEEFSWTKADNNSWAIPNSVQDLDEDPLHSYDASATLNNVVLNICRAPDQLQLNQLHDKDFVIKIENTAQSDSGANANITPHLQLLRDVRWFDPVSIGNAQKDSTLTVTAIGKFPLQTDQGIILINMYYSPNATNTIISPTAICSQVDHTDGFHQWSNIRSKKGYLEFIRSDSIDEANFRVMLVEDNGLWYHSEAGYVSSTSDSSLQVNALSDAAKYELWHQRLGHCGAWALENAHKHCIGVPKLRGHRSISVPHVWRESCAPNEATISVPHVCRESCAPNEATISVTVTLEPSSTIVALSKKLQLTILRSTYETPLSSIIPFRRTILMNFICPTLIPVSTFIWTLDLLEDLNMF